MTKDELEFLARPFVYEREQDVRTFCAFKNDKPIAFCSFDPIYQNGEVIKYAINHMRAYRNAPKGVIDFIIISALEKFRKELFNEVSLGFSPFYEMDHTKFRASPVTSWLLNTLYERGNKLYGFKNLGFHKDRYRPVKTHTYLATQKKFTPVDIFLLFKVNKVF